MSQLSSWEEERRNIVEIVKEEETFVSSVRKGKHERRGGLCSSSFRYFLGEGE